MKLWDKLMDAIKNPRKSLFEEKNTLESKLTKTALNIGLAIEKKTKLTSINKYRRAIGQNLLPGRSRDYSLTKLQEYESELSQKIRAANFAQKRLEELLQAKQEKVEIKKTAKTAVKQISHTPIIIKKSDEKNTDIRTFSDAIRKPRQTKSTNRKKTCRTKKIPKLQATDGEFSKERQYATHMNLAKEALALDPTLGQNLEQDNSAEYHLRKANKLIPGTIAGIELAQILINSTDFNSAIQILNEQEKHYLDHRTGAKVYILRATSHFWQGNFKATISNFGKLFKKVKKSKGYISETDYINNFLMCSKYLKDGTRNKTTDTYAEKLVNTAQKNKNPKFTSKLYEYAAKLSSDNEVALQYARLAVSNAIEDDEKYVSALQTLAETYHLAGQKGCAGLTLKRALQWMAENPKQKKQLASRYEELKNLEEFYFSSSVNLFNNLFTEQNTINDAMELIKKGEKDHALAKKLYALGKRKDGNSTKLYHYATLLTDGKNCAIACGKLAVNESNKYQSLDERLTTRMTLAELYLSNVDTNKSALKESRKNYRLAQKFSREIKKVLDKHAKAKRKYDRIYDRANTINTLTTKILERLE